MHAGPRVLPHPDRDLAASKWPDGLTRPIFICVLGPFRVLRAGRPVAMRGEKVVALLGHLALHYAGGVPRDVLRAALWPESDPVLAGVALHSRVHSLHKLLGAELGGVAPVVYADGSYRLNGAAGVGVDVPCFDALVSAGDREIRAGNAGAGAVAYRRAVDLYRGDLCVGTDIHAVLERERLRTCFLTLLARLADYAYGERDYLACLNYAYQLINTAPCHEEAHRLIMRCHVRRGERVHALQQYRLCTEILGAEFAATPEPATVALFDQVRLDPGSI